MNAVLPLPITRLLERIGAGRDLALAFGVIAIIGMLILPIPAWLLDIGLALSITLSVMNQMAGVNRITIPRMNHQLPSGFIVQAGSMIGRDVPPFTVAAGVARRG